MPPSHVTIPYRMDLPYSVEDAYAWLTDYTDEDPTLTTAIVKKRPVVERTAERVVLDGEIEVMGRRMGGRAIVMLHPPNRWVATFDKGGSVYEYALEERPGGGSRLRVAYRIGVRSWKGWWKVTLARPLVKRNLDEMWKGFAANMAKDLA